MQWYYAENGQQRGPVEDDALAALVNSGAVRDDTLVWHEGMQNWQSYGSMRAATAAPGSPAPGLASAHVANYTAAAHGVFFAGFWIRFLARILDNIILSISSFIAILVLVAVRYMLGFSLVGPIALIGLPGATTFLWILVLLLWPCYEIVLISSKGATIGKMVVGIRVVRTDGLPISASQSVGRYLAKWLSGLILYIGYVIAAFDPEKRALHDRICETRVIHLR